MRYYSTQRPVSPGSYPTGVVISIVNFDTKRYVHEIGGNAWGYIEYGIELSTEDAHAYELVPAPPVRHRCSCCKPHGLWLPKCHSVL